MGLGAGREQDLLKRDCDGYVRLRVGRGFRVNHAVVISFRPPQLLRYRRYTRDKCARRDIIDNNCACGHYRTVSDFDIAKYHAVRTQPNIVADDDRTDIMTLAPNRLN